MPVKLRNVLLFLTDQQRKDTLGAFGNPFVQTPALDGLAACGVRFERAYCTNPFCCPSRAGILTGLHPRTHVVWHNGIRFDEVGAPTLGDILGSQGYRTGSVGKIHLGPGWGPAPPAGFEESREYWAKHPEMRDWHGPYCGFQDVEMIMGHVHYSTQGGHYGSYLQENFSDGLELFRRDHALLNRGYYETWRNAMPEEHHYNTWIADRTIDMLDRFAREPFFIHCSFPDPHHPLSACEPYSSMYDPDDMPEPLAPSLDELEQLHPVYRAYHLGEENYFAQPPSFPEKIAGTPLREMMAQMHGMVTHVDRSIGRILEHLAELGLMEDTLVVFTTDHGELMGDHGLVLKGPFYYQSLLNVPLIISIPGSAPRVVSDLVSHVDLIPTILECLGLEVPAYLPGRSLADALRGEEGKARDCVLTEFRPFGGPNMKVLHTSEWRYVYYGGEPYGELFNLRDDPEERVNLFGRPECAEVQASLQARLLKELVKTEARWPARGPWI